MKSFLSSFFFLLILSGCIEVEFSAPLKLEDGVESLSLKNHKGEDVLVYGDLTSVKTTFSKKQKTGTVELQNDFGLFIFPIHEHEENIVNKNLVRLYLPASETEQRYDLMIDYRLLETDRETNTDYMACTYLCDRPERLCPGMQWIRVTTYYLEELGLSHLIDPEESKILSTMDLGPRAVVERRVESLSSCH